jgi:hypothetical protein
VDRLLRWRARMCGIFLVEPAYGPVRGGFTASWDMPMAKTKQLGSVRHTAPAATPETNTIVLDTSADGSLELRATNAAREVAKRIHALEIGVTVKRDVMIKRAVCAMTGDKEHAG